MEKSKSPCVIIYNQLFRTLTIPSKFRLISWDKDNGCLPYEIQGFPRLFHKLDLSLFHKLDLSLFYKSDEHCHFARQFVIGFHLLVNFAHCMKHCGVIAATKPATNFWQ